MNYSIDCPCGNRILVTAAQAGTPVQCTCGQSVPVPALSRLRQTAGERKYEIHIVDKIRQMLSDGSLPNGQSCIECGVETSNILDLIVECQQPWVRGNSYWKTLLLTLFFMFHKEIQDDYRNPEVMGSELIVRAPLRICADCSSKLKVRQRPFEQLLRKEPVYDELLREYPTARIIVQHA